jgi:glycosyltransferase involved in cell wall biosynthesis
VLPFYREMTWGVPRTLTLWRWLTAAHIDLVQCATPGPMGLAAMMAARHLHLPVCAQYHTEVAEYAARMTRSPRLGRAAARMVGWFYRHADLCLAPSADTAARLASYGVDPERIVQVPRGIDLSLFHPSMRDRSALVPYGLSERPTIVYVGRLSREKNLSTLLAAFAQVRERRPDAALLLVGGGPLEGQLSGPGVTLTGWLRGQQLAGVVASCDLFAFASETETFGNAVAEAQAAGLPAVVANRGAAPERIVPGITGLAVDASGPDAMAAALLRLLDDPELRARMGRAAHHHAQRHDPDRAALGTFDIYRRFLAGRVRPTEAP